MALDNVDPISPQKNTKIQLVCIDVDGTLLNENFELTHATIQALKLAKTYGLQVVIATGRGYPSTVKILEDLNLHCAVINSGGAQIRIPGQLPINKGFTRQQAKLIIGLALSKRSGVFIDQPHQDIWFGNLNFIQMFQHVNAGKPAKNVKDLLFPTPNKISIINEPLVIASIRRDLEHNHPFPNMASPFAHVLDITPVNASKGNALITVCEVMKINLKNTAAIGDSDNDLSMFDAAGLSVAMGNAPFEIQLAADWIAPPNTENGVVWFINQILR